MDQKFDYYLSNFINFDGQLIQEHTATSLTLKNLAIFSYYHDYDEDGYSSQMIINNLEN